MLTNAFRIIFGVCLLGILAASLVDYSDIPFVDLSTGGGAGLIYHFLGYLIATILSWIAFRHHHNRMIFIIGILLFVLGIGLETLQIYLPYRTFNPKDIAANTLGLFAACLCILMWRTIRDLCITRRKLSLHK